MIRSYIDTSISDLVKESAELRKFYNEEDLSHYEALKITIELQRNYMYAKAHVLEWDSTPSALEMIAMNLGDIAAK